MQPKTPKHLEDIRDAAAFIQDSARGRTFDDYCTDRMLRQAIERNFEIIGEAMNRIARQDPDVAARISDYPRIIAFRNVLSHGYDLIEDQEVWEIIQKQLPVLQREVEAVLRDVPGET